MSVILFALSCLVNNSLVSQFGLLTFVKVLEMVLLCFSLEMGCFVNWLMITFVL